VVHRDLKPANVLIQRAGPHRYLVADFGIGDMAARRSLDQSLRGTSQGALPTMLVGAHTPLYASKQQKNGDPADVRDDVFALGVIWYQLLVSDLGSERPSGRWRKRLESAGMPAALLDLLEGCCDDDPAERAADAAELAEKIGRHLQGQVTPPPPPPATDVDSLIQQQRYEEAVRLLEAVPRERRDYPRLIQVREQWKASANQAADYLATQQRDYEGAVTTLTALPDSLRDADRLERYGASAAEVKSLADEIDAAADNHRLTPWLRLKLDRLLQLDPNHRHRGLVKVLGDIPATPGKPWQAFSEWHKGTVGRLRNVPHIGLYILIFVWFAYGFIWIPLWYLIEQWTGHAPRQQERQAKVQQIEAELRSLGK
jgi:serine/threonine protein kinase